MWKSNNLARKVRVFKNHQNKYKTLMVLDYQTNFRILIGLSILLTILYTFGNQRFRNR